METTLEGGDGRFENRKPRFNRERGKLKQKARIQKAEGKNR
jgi:hypothetical protein